MEEINEMRTMKTEDNSDLPVGAIKVASWFIPIIGFILYFVWYKDRPTLAKSCGKLALINTIIIVVLAIVLLVLVALGVVGLGAAFLDGIAEIAA